MALRDQGVAGSNPVSPTNFPGADTSEIPERESRSLLALCVLDLGWTQTSPPLRTTAETLCPPGSDTRSPARRKRVSPPAWRVGDRGRPRCSARCDRRPDEGATLARGLGGSHDRFPARSDRAA